jgi:hypothetical protein
LSIKDIFSYLDLNFLKHKSIFRLQAVMNTYCSDAIDHGNVHGKSKQKIRLNMILKDETARMLVELRARGVIRSYADGVNQAIQLFYDKIIERDLSAARLKVLRLKQEEDETD